MEVVRNQNGSYSAHVFADRAIKIVRQHALHNRDQPLFLYMPSQSVHAPLEVPGSYKNKYSFIKNASRRIYAGCSTHGKEKYFEIIYIYIFILISLLIVVLFHIYIYIYIYIYILFQ
ncbi:hypothetical protein LSH36_1929g00003 [Paralvinella palmiformis]|uniref:Sulfatase N-terminal domain-containing protein n=1 Tax=Paralvinella palmiformis TaxID=53620 RepID=A0AAD9IRB9_9ANNE|nr:hypothetical protein LSH36_1929g00003 [Paralvinella palmiformis]